MKDIGTDTYNFRCTYCILNETLCAEYQILSQRKLFDFEVIIRLAERFSKLAVHEIRLIGEDSLKVRIKTN